MAIQKKWALAGGMLVLGLSLWGFFGGGTALSVFPEPQNEIPEIQEEPDEEDLSSPIRRYDATSHLRGKPLRDPFHAEGIAKIDEEMKKNLSQSRQKSESPSSSTGKTDTGAGESTLPRLKGTLSFQGKRRAMLEWNGKVKTVSEGEHLGPWTISEIGENRAVLESDSGTVTVTER